MGKPRSERRSLLRIGVVGLHALLLLAAVVVPGYAVIDAARALLDSAGPEHSATLVALSRWPALLWNTVNVCGVAVASAGLVGGILALLATRTDVPGGRLLGGAALFAACVPVYVSTVAIFSVRAAYQLANPPSAVACGLMYGLIHTPLAGLVIGAALRATDRDLEDQAALDAGPWTVLRRVTLPQAGWGLAVSGMLVILLVATDITITDVLAVRTFAEEAYTEYALGRPRAGPLLSAIPILIVLAGLLAGLQIRYRLFGEHSPWQLGAQPRVIRLGRWRRLGGVACAGVVAVGLGGPLVLLVRRSLPLHGLGTAIAGVQRELWTSAVLAISGATLVVLPALGLAWSAVRGRWTRLPVCAAIVLLLAVPAPVVGISLIAMLNRPGALGWIYDSPLAVVIGYFVRFLPIGVLLLIPAVQRVPQEVELAARVDGCDWVQEHWHIRLPALAADATLAWLVVVIFCFAELGATVLLVPPGWTTASVRFATLIHWGVYRDLAVLALLSVGFILLPWGLLLWLLRRILRPAAEGRDGRRCGG